MDYFELNDNELIYMINESNENAYECLYNKYKNVIYKISLKYINKASLYGLDINDLVLEGYLAFDTAIKNYKDLKNNSKFYSFLYSCVEHNIQNIIRNNAVKKHSVLNDAVKYEQNYELIKNIKDTQIANIDEQLILNQDSKHKYNIIMKKLSSIEQEVFKLKYKNYTTKEIAIIIGKNIKAVNNALERIRKKKKLLNID